jgi:Ca2+-binding EF-hand superfamily protein
LSTDGEKGITFEQFVTAFTTNITDDLRKDRIKHLYNMLCDGNAEKGIDVEDMKKLVKNVGESLCVSEIQEIVSRLSKNGKSITLEEFTAILCSNDSIAEQPEE